MRRAMSLSHGVYSSFFRIVKCNRISQANVKYAYVSGVNKTRKGNLDIVIWRMNYDRYDVVKS